MKKFRRNIRRNLMLMLLGMMVASLVVIPLVASAQSIPDLEGYYFAKIDYTTTDIDGTAVTLPFKYFGVTVRDVNNTTGVVVGYLHGYNVTSISGAKVRGGTVAYNATIDRWRNRQNLSTVLTTVNVTAEGTLGVYVPAYCVGEADDGDTGVIDSSPVELSAGWNTLNVTTAGDIVVMVVPWPYGGLEPLADLFGLVGEGSAARFTLYATDITTEVDDTEDNVLTAVTEATVIMGTTTFVVGNNVTGNLTVTMPYGTTGNVTATGCTVDGKSSVDLESGENVILVADTGDPGGTIDVTVVTLVTFQWSGRVRGSAGHYNLDGYYNWFSLTDMAVLNGKLTAVHSHLLGL